MGMPVNTSILEQEMAPLNAQIEQVLKQREALDGELRVVETELEKFSAAKQRFDALRDVCEALDKLGQLKADELFWKGIPEPTDTAGHLERVRSRVSRFSEKIGGILQKQTDLQAQIEQRLDELDYLYDEVRDVHEREARRMEEFVVEREISPLPYRAMVMPWTKEAESEKRFRRLVLVALLLCFMFGALVPLVNVPIPDRSVAVVEIPERLAMLVKNEPPKPAALPKPEPPKVAEETKPKPAPEKQDTPPKGGGPAPEPTKLAAGGGGAPSARKKAESVGVLAFKNTFQDLMQETPIAKLGTEARLNQDTKAVAGQAVAQRSLVAMQARSGTSGGIGNYGFSRNLGSGNADRGGGGGIGAGGGGNGDGTGFGRVASAIAGRGEAPRPLSDGVDAGRTDEEIQIVFDRYKAALYRIYNTELRKDPTLRGKMLLRISIEAGGEVSLCKVESTDLGSPVLVAQIVERILRFNFGPKEGVPKTTILYPIDFLPAG
jgi:outer membrane biosynthesis protein TonB